MASSPSQRWTHHSAPINQLSESSPGFKGLLSLQDNAIQLLQSELGDVLIPNLAPDFCSEHASSSASSLDLDTGDYYCTSEDKTAAAACIAYTGPNIRWINPSAVVATAMGFGSTRLMGWGKQGHSAPHLLVNATAVGNEVALNVAYWPRMALNDREYYDFYYRSHLAGMSSLISLGETLSNNPNFTPYEAEQAGGPNTQINVKFAPTDVNFASCSDALKQIITQWAGFQLQASLKPESVPGGHGLSKEEVLNLVAKNDEIYAHHLACGSGNKVALRLFGRQATGALIGFSCCGVYAQYVGEE